MKKTCAWLLTTLLLLFTAIPAFAAAGPADDWEYQIAVDGTVIDLLRDGRVEKTVTARTSGLKLYQYGSDIYIEYQGKESVPQTVLLGETKNIEIDGSIGLLDLHGSLSDNFQVVLPQTAKLTTLNAAAGNVQVYGSVNTVNTTSTQVRVQVMEDGKVSHANVAASYTVTGLPYSMQKNLIDEVDEDALFDGWTRDRYDDRYDDDYRTRDVDVYFDGRRISSGDTITLGDSNATLRDASRELDRRCSARDYARDRSVSGTFRFDGDTESRVRDGARYAWTFVPNNSDYRREYGSMVIYVR